MELRSINGDDEGALGGNGVKEILIRVLGELIVTLDGNFDGLLLGVEGAVQRVTEVRVVRVLVFGGKTEDLSVTESDFSSCTVAATGATTLVRVLDTADELLSGESLQVAGSDGSLGFNRSDGSESPA